MARGIELRVDSLESALRRDRTPREAEVGRSHPLGRWSSGPNLSQLRNAVAASCMARVRYRFVPGVW